MARPAKSVSVISKNLTKEELKIRQETEEKLKGAADNISPPSHLNAKQKKIFNNIVAELKESGILGNLDIYILSTCAIAIDRLQQIEKMINKDFALMSDRTLMSSKEKYTKDLFRCCTELCLSPASRARIGNINLNAENEKEDPLLKALSGG